MARWSWRLAGGGSPRLVLFVCSPLLTPEIGRDLRGRGLWDRMMAHRVCHDLGLVIEGVASERLQHQEEFLGQHESSSLTHSLWLKSDEIRCEYDHLLRSAAILFVWPNRIMTSIAEILRAKRRGDDRTLPRNRTGLRGSLKLYVGLCHQTVMSP